MLEQGYGIMPNMVLFDDELSSTAKLVFVYISSLCAKRGYCWASNENIGAKFGISPTQVSRLISSLKAYIEVSDGNSGKRSIRIRDERAYAKSAKQPTQKAQGSLAEKRKHNSTSEIVQENSTSLSAEVVHEDFDTVEARTMTEHLLSLVKKNYDFVKAEPTDKDVHQMYLLRTRDGFSWEQIKFILEWSQQDAFWQQNIRSATKLRKQFETLVIRAKSDYERAKKNTVVSV